MAGASRRFALALAVALGFAYVFLVHELVNFVLSSVRRNGTLEYGGAYPFQYVAHIGRHTLAYGESLAWLLTFAIVLLTAWLVRRRFRPAEIQRCPHCLSRVPSGARVCRACTRELTTSYPVGY